MNTMIVNSKQKNQCWLLVKNRLMAQLGFNVFRYEKDSRKRNSKIATTIAIIVVVFMMASYCGGMAYGYVSMGLTQLIPGIALVITSLFTLFFTMFKANGEFFGFKDYDTVMSLPISVRTIVNSRFLNMYIWNTFIAFLVMLPMGIVYAISANPSISFYAIWLAGLLLASLIPTTLAAIFGAVITAFASKYRHANAVSTILSIVLIVAFLVFSMSTTASNSGLGTLFDAKSGNINVEVVASIAPAISGVMNRVYPPTRLFSDAVVDGNLVSFALFTGVSIGWYALFVLLLSLKFKQINTALTSHTTRADYKLETLHQGSALSALYKKTMMRILKSTVAATNLLIGCVLAILMAVAMLVVGPDKVFQSLNAGEFMPIIKSAACYVVAALVCMTNVAAVALALEGKNVWLVKSLPITPKTLYDSYILTNLTFTIPTALICSVLFSIALKTGFIGTVLMILTPLTFALFTSVAGIFVGNRLAYYDWQDETQLIKQSTLTVIGLLGGMVLIAICGAIANTGILPLEANLITFIFNILFLVLAAVIYLNESNRPIKA